MIVSGMRPEISCCKQERQLCKQCAGRKPLPCRGDEFVIICPDVEEAEFRDIIQKLKDTFNREECKAAVGYEWTQFLPQSEGYHP